MTTTDELMRLAPMARLLTIMARLRDPDGGCPWDLEQNFATIAPHTIEEAYEVADAIAHGDKAALKDELGDLLFQVVFYAQMAAEDGDFDFDAIAETICNKMIARHPHVFGGQDIATSAAQRENWEALKARERADKASAQGRKPSVLDGVTLALPGLTRALKLQNRAARVGFDWTEMPPILEKMQEELSELQHELANGGDPDRLQDEIGDILFVGANLARRTGVDPETALRTANDKFERRFRRIEQLLEDQGRSPDDATLDEMDALWDAAKAEGK